MVGNHRMRLRQAAAAVVLLALAVLRALMFTQLAARLDATFFVLLGAALVLLLFPLDRLRSFKAGGVEFALDEPTVLGAIASLNLDRLQDEKLRHKLLAISTDLPLVRGGRVLWIDDQPHRIAGERRLLRSLGIDVTPAISSDEALRILDHDNDFDLILTDVQRTGRSHEAVGGEPIHEGVNFVVWLRTTYHDPLVRSLPVVFYAAYDNEWLVKFTRSARDLAPEAALSNSVVTLVPLVVAQLAEARAAPIRAPGTKEPTRVEGDA